MHAGIAPHRALVEAQDVVGPGPPVAQESLLATTSLIPGESRGT
jgi:hypothetical protein